MYSVVLATVLAASASTPDWHGHGYYGCYGCYGCHGCWGGYYGCHGCSGYAFGCGGCCGGYYYGCGGCYGGCYGGYYYGCGGCCGGYYYGCGGCCGAVYSYPVVVAGGQQAVAQQQGGGQGAAAQETLKKLTQVLENMDMRLRKLEGGGKESRNQGPDANKAEVIVQLPSDARLYVDNVPCPLTSGTRTFQTPQLDPGRKYYYILRAEVVRNGQTHSENLRVILGANQQVRVEFSTLMPLAQTVQR